MYFPITEFTGGLLQHQTSYSRNEGRLEGEHILCQQVKGQLCMVSYLL